MGAPPRIGAIGPPTSPADPAGASNNVIETENHFDLTDQAPQ